MLEIILVGDHDETSAGSALITFVEAHPGHALAYNRCYEHDHFYSGVVMGPWELGGPRFVASPALGPTPMPDAQAGVPPPIGPAPEGWGP
jgi:hypothetical protein